MAAPAGGRPWPGITIVTPSLNQGQYLEETLRSVLLQGYPNLEYIVIDGGSRDGSVALLERYAPWLHYWVSEPDRGQANAINKGLRRGTGVLQGYLNSDDILLPGALFHAAAAYRAARRRERLIVSFAGERAAEGEAPVTAQPAGSPSLASWMSGRDSLFQPATFWAAGLYRRCGGFDESFDFCFDKEFFLKAVFLEGRYQAVRNVTVCRFRLHDASKTSRLDSVCECENARLRERFGALRGIRRRLRRESVRAASREAIAAALADRNARKAAAGLMSAVRRDPGLWLDRPFLGACRRVIGRTLSCWGRAGKGGSE